MDMTFGEIVSVPAIMVLCLLAGEIVKCTALDKKWIPVICGCFGLTLGVVAFVIQIPNFPAHDPVTAAAVGVASGLAATGVHQAVKQLHK